MVRGLHFEALDLPSPISAQCFAPCTHSSEPPRKVQYLTGEKGCLAQTKKKKKIRVNSGWKNMCWKTLLQTVLLSRTAREEVFNACPVLTWCPTQRQISVGIYWHVRRGPYSSDPPKWPHAHAAGPLVEVVCAPGSSAYPLLSCAYVHRQRKPQHFRSITETKSP